VPQPVLDEIGRLGAGFATVIGSALSPAVDGALTGRGVTVERVGASHDLRDFSAEVATWSRPLTGSRTAVVVDGAPAAAYAPAAALANAHAAALLIGDTAAVRGALGTPRPVRISYVVSPDAGAAGRWPGGRALASADPVRLSAMLSETLVTLRGGNQHLQVAPAAAPHLAAVAASVPGPLLLHPPGGLAGVLDWVLSRRTAVGAGLIIGDRSSCSDAMLHDLQAGLNEFDAHLLTGSAG
jgi:hypothetical protein